MATSDKKRIAKNTLLLYVRMLFVMAVSIFTSRIILEKLGVTDFGIYSSVAGVVTMLGFLNATLSTGTSRFITFELGRGNEKRLKDTFSTAFHSHVILGAIVSLILILGGTWFVSHKLIIPDEMIKPALWTFYLSILTTFVSITQVPYTATIIAHERMNVYAYLGVFEALAKLGIAYAISLAPIEKIVWYAILVASVQIIIAMGYRVYCIKNYKESHITRTFDKGILKQLLSFSGWGLLAQIAEVFISNQGLVVIINMFFVPAIAAAQAVSVQVSHAVMQFINNVRTALNPQIIKLYASGDYEKSQELTLTSTVYVFDLMLMLGLPIIYAMDPLLHLWLKEVPPYAVVFTQYVILRNICGIFSNSFYTPLLASAQIRQNSIICFFVSCIEFAVMYIMLKLGFDVMWIQYIAVIQTFFYSFVVKPYLLMRYVDYKFKDIMVCFFNCIKVAVLPVLFVLLLYYMFPDKYGVAIMLLRMALIGLVVVASSLFFMDKIERKKLFEFIVDKIKGGQK